MIYNNGGNNEICAREGKGYLKIIIIHFSKYSCAKLILTTITSWDQNRHLYPLVKVVKLRHLCFYQRSLFGVLQNKRIC